MLMRRNTPVKINTGKTLEERIEDLKRKNLLEFVNENITSENFICLDRRDVAMNNYSFGREMTHSMCRDHLKEYEPNMDFGTILHLLAWYEAYPNLLDNCDLIIAPGTIWYNIERNKFNYLPVIVKVGGKICLDIRPIEEYRGFPDTKKENLFPANAWWIVFYNPLNRL
jgi:hypothetical protein